MDKRVVKVGQWQSDLGVTGDATGDAKGEATGKATGGWLAFGRADR